MSDAVDYRIAQPVMVRLIGAYLVTLALVLLVLTAVLLGAGGTPDVLVIVLAVGVLGLIGLAWWLRRLAVVRLTARGYRVRMVRAAGLAQGSWSDVEDVVAASPRDVDCVVIRMRDGRSTTIPVALIAADKDDFARDVRRHLQAAAG